MSGLSGLCRGVLTDVSSTADQDWAVRREDMVRTQIRDRGITNPRVLAAMSAVPRHRFVPADRQDEQDRAYADGPAPIGYGQTISQPYIVAFMTDAIDPQPGDRVLEIGTGSGYQTAVLAEIVRDVYTIEFVPPLGERARQLLDALGYRNVHTRIGSGYDGWPEAAPFDKVVVTAAPDAMPSALVAQLAVGGLLVVPIGLGEQTLTVVHNTDHGLSARDVLPVRFVPMVKGRTS